MERVLFFIIAMFFVLTILRKPFDAHVKRWRTQKEIKRIQERMQLRQQSREELRNGIYYLVPYDDHQLCPEDKVYKL